MLAWTLKDIPGQTVLDSMLVELTREVDMEALEDSVVALDWMNVPYPPDADRTAEVLRDSRWSVSAREIFRALVTTAFGYAVLWSI